METVRLYLLYGIIPTLQRFIIIVTQIIIAQVSDVTLQGGNF